MRRWKLIFHYRPSSFTVLLSEMLRDVAMPPTRFLETNEVMLDVSGFIQRSISVLKDTRGSSAIPVTYETIMVEWQTHQ
jgi:hypothetical protein